MANLEISLLGTVQILRDRASTVEFSSKKVRALLVFLAVESGLPHSRETLAALLWPESPEAAALASLRNALASLRRSIGDREACPPYLLISSEALQFNRDSDYHLDVEDLLWQSSARPISPDPHHAAELERCSDAVACYHGPFLAGLSVPGSAAFEEWASLWRERLERLALDEMRALADIYEACGETSRALEYARRLVALDPWLEESQRQAMRLLALGGQRSAALLQYENCRRALVEDLGVEPSIETRRLYETIRAGELADLRPRRLQPAPGDPPYRGLRFFDEADSDWFFGREALVAGLVERVRKMAVSSSPHLVVVGASGSGKSSLVRAGVIPGLKKLGWRVRVITPTARPLLALDSPGEWDLLVIDQFEELFCLCREEEERAAFLARIFDPCQPVLMVLRADFYGLCAPYLRLRAALSARQEFIGSMDAAELLRAIEEPAQRGGWELEPGLAELILRDTGVSGNHPPEPGALPLLEHALFETWLRRRGRQLTLAGYQESGGVRGAIAQTAERIYNSLAPEGRVLARSLFLRLTELGDGTQDTRRRASFAELRNLGGNRQAIDELLRLLAEARLVTLNEETAEVAHEALICEWPALHGWLSENREGLRLHRRLTENSAAWDRLGRDPGELYHGARLAQAWEWARQADSGQELTALELDFLQASKDGEEREALDREAQRQRELAAARRIAEVERQHAEEREQARQQTWQDERRAYARELAAHSKDRLAPEPDVGLLLALEAVKVLQKAGLPVPWEVQQAVHDVALTSRLVWSKQGVGSNMAAFAPDGRRVFCEANLDIDSERIYALDAESGDELFWVQSDGVGLGLSPDGKYLAGANGARAVLWDALSGQEVLTIPLAHPDNLHDGGCGFFSPNGRYLQVGDDWDHLLLVDLGPWLASGAPVGVAPDLPMKRIEHSSWNCPNGAFSPDSKTFTTAWEKDFSVTLWDTETGQPLRSFMGHTSYPRIDSFSPDGRLLATCSFDDTIRIWDVASARELRCFPAHTGGIHCVHYSPDGKRLASASNDALAMVWNAENGRKLLELHPGGPAYAVAFHPNGERLLVTSFLDIVSMWDISQAGRGELRSVSRSLPINWVSGSPDGVQIVEARPDGQIFILDGASLGEVSRLAVSPAPGDQIFVSMSYDHSQLAAHAAGRICVWSVDNGQLLFEQLMEEGWKALYALFSPAFSPDGILLASGGYPKRITLWNIVSGQKELELALRPGALPRFCQFSPDGRWLAVGCNRTEDPGGGDAWIWDLAEPGKPALILNVDHYFFSYLSFSPDNSCLACCGGGVEGQIWNLASARKCTVLGGHSATLNSIRYSPDGHYLVTTSQDGTARVWDAQSGLELLCYRSPNEAYFHEAFFTPDSRRVVACSSDGVYRLLVFQDFEELLEIVRARVTRDWKAEERRRYLHEGQSLRSGSQDYPDDSMQT